MNEISKIINYYINNPKEFLFIILENPITIISLALVMTWYLYSLYMSVLKEND